MSFLGLAFEDVLAVVGGSHSWKTQDVTGLKH